MLHMGLNIADRLHHRLHHQADMALLQSLHIPLATVSKDFFHHLLFCVLSGYDEVFSTPKLLLVKASSTNKSACCCCPYFLLLFVLHLISRCGGLYE